MGICEEVRETIEETFPRSQADLAGVAQVWDHFQECEACREFGERLVALNQSLDGWKSPIPSKGLQGRIMAGIAQIERDRSNRAKQYPFAETLRGLFLYRFQVPAAGAFAAIFLLILSVAFNFHQMRNEGGTTASVVSAEEVSDQGSVPLAGPIQGVVHSVAPTISAPPAAPIQIPDAKVVAANPYTFGDGATPPPVIVILASPPPGLLRSPYHPAQTEISRPVDRKENQL